MHWLIDSVFFLLLLPTLDHGQPQESRASHQTDRVGPGDQAERYPAQPQEPRLLLPVRQGRGAGQGQGEIIS